MQASSAWLLEYLSQSPRTGSSLTHDWLLMVQGDTGVLRALGPVHALLYD